jgi:hypothetical protein
MPQKRKISLHETEATALLDNLNQLRGEKRILVKAFQTRLKDVKEESSAMKKLLIKENRTLYKSFSAEVKKLEQHNQVNDIKIEQYKSKLGLLKEDNKESAAVSRTKGVSPDLPLDSCLMIQSG